MQRPFPMKSLFPYFGIVLLVCLARPAAAESSSVSSKHVKPGIHGPLQVTIIKRDAHENVIEVQKVGLAQAISLASQLVPGAISKIDSDIKTLTITYN
jgi:hypothetical protein